MLLLRRLVALLIGVLGLLAPAPRLHAQAPAPAAPPLLVRPMPAVADEGSVRVLQPDTFLLPDKNGDLQTVLRFPFEDFLEAVKIKNQLDGPEKQPRYSLQQLQVSGVAGGEHAQLRIELSVLARTSDWVRVPLGLPQVVLREPAKHEGKGEHFLHFDQERNGYVSWIRGEADQTHKLTLEVLAPLVKLGGETALQLGAPRATTSSFQIDVSLAQAVGRLVDSTQPLTTKHERNITRFSGLGLGGEFELAWRSGDRPTVNVPTALEANGIILARIDGRSVRSEARLTVRSFGGEFEQFRVRLPPGAELIVGNQPGYTLAPVEDAGDAKPERGASRLVDVKLDRKTAGPVEVRLVTEQSRELAGADRAVELAGFEVVNAIRQWGHFAVEVVGDWQLSWGVKRNIRQVEDLPDTLRRAEVVAGFEYFSQPFSLPARVIPRTTRVRVEPEYLVFVGARQASLEARLKYTVRGAKAFSFNLQMRGWDVETVSPPNVVDVDAIITSDKGQVSIPLLQPTTGEVELVVKARRDLGAAGAPVELPLPIAEASSQTPSTVIVLADDNVELTPLLEKITGLTPMQVAPRVALPARQQSPLFYRGEADPPTFAAGLEVHPQAITTKASSVVRLDPDGGRVNQTFAYRIAYEPLDVFTLEAPRSLAASGQLQVTFEGQTLPTQAVSTGAGDEGAATNTTKLRVVLPKAKIGACELRISYPLAMPEIEPQQSVVLVAPLVMPLDGELEKNEVTVSPASGVRVSHRKGTWTEVELPQPRRTQRDLQLEADARAVDLPLALQHEERLSPGSTVVYRIWLQTWLTPTARQDRACFRFTSNESDLVLRLPEGVEPNGIEASLDDTLIAVNLDRANGLTIPLPPLPNGVRRKLELRYNFRERGDGLGRFALAAPQLEGGILIENFYWQLVLPRDEHLVAAPENLIPEFAWGWHDFYWGRRPLRDQTELETWVGAAAGVQPPPTTNQYLFSSLQVPAAIEMRTASRSAIVLTCSAVVLVIGLLLLYAPLVRHPGVLFVAAIALAALGVLYPEPALLAAQAAVLGVVLALLASLLKRSAARRPVEVTSSASKLLPPSRVTTEMPLALHPPAAPPSSATTTVALQVSEPNL